MVPRNSRHVLGGICTMQVPHNLSLMAEEELDDLLQIDQIDYDLSIQGVMVSTHPRNNVAETAASFLRNGERGCDRRAMHLYLRGHLDGIFSNAGLFLVRAPPRFGDNRLCDHHHPREGMCYPACYIRAYGTGHSRRWWIGIGPTERTK